MDIKDVKQHLNQHVKLTGSDVDYILTGCIFRKGKEKFFYQAELQDVSCGHCIVIDKLENVEGTDI